MKPGRGCKKGEGRAAVLKTSFAGTVTCRRCGKSFPSPDRRSVTRCDKCRLWMETQEASLSCEAARFEVGVDGVWASMQKSPTKQSAKRAKRWDEINDSAQARHYEGIAYRRLTPHEIAREYTYDRVEGILTQARGR